MHCYSQAFCLLTSSSMATSWSVSSFLTLVLAMSMAVPAESSAKAVGIIRRAPPLKMEIGGRKHSEEKVATNANDVVVSERPELAKSEQCKDDKCEECIIRGL